MGNRLKQVLAGNINEGYIIPFFWQTGNKEEDIINYIDAMYHSGIKSFCVEARPHPDFLGEQWWRDMDLILKEAETRDMRVWLLDDSHFPTGYMNGEVKLHKGAEKWFLTHYNIDVEGPLEGASFFVHLEKDERIWGAVLAKRVDKQRGDLSQAMDLSNYISEDRIYVDIPPGHFSISIIKVSSHCAGRPDYINMVDKKAIRLFIDTIYEPHYQHYKRFFGNTFAGFFSDEPQMGNGDFERYGLDAGIGRSDMPLPWCQELDDLLLKKWGENYAVRCLALWHEIDEISPEARVDYMNILTRLYQKNFSDQIGRWCHLHGVEYIGHVIEDQGCHTKLGLGTGHFFRALSGQDMAGIDVVLQQIRPGFDDMSFYRIGGQEFYDGTFFHYGLGKLGASEGHQDPKKHGRTICEIFGAYGWGEGLKLMKWLADHMMVRGINYFIPHAFSMGEFPDPDCPPHFYARGNNPQFQYFKYLIRYMNRVCHLINGGVHVPVAAVLYHAQAQWASGQYGKIQPFETVGKMLMQAQIDYEIVPMDRLYDCEIHDKKLHLAMEECDCLIIPESEYLPDEFLTWCEQAKIKGLPIIFMNRFPKALSSGKTLLNATFQESTSLMSIKDLISYMRKHRFFDIFVESPLPHLRYYHYRQKEGDYYLFFNESVAETINTKVQFSGSIGNIYLYDAFNNMLTAPEACDNWFRLMLEPGEAAIACVDVIDDQELCGAQTIQLKREHIAETMDISDGFRLSTLLSDGSRYKETVELEVLSDITRKKGFEKFSGVMEYKKTVNVEHPGKWILDLGNVYESVEVWINGKSVGVRIAPSYQFVVSDHLIAGENRIKVRVVNTLAHQIADEFSMTMPLEPSGLLGPVQLRRYI